MEENEIYCKIITSVASIQSHIYANRMVLIKTTLSKKVDGKPSMESILDFGKVKNIISDLITFFQQENPEKNSHAIHNLLAILNGYSELVKNELERAATSYPEDLREIEAALANCEQISSDVETICNLVKELKNRRNKPDLVNA